MVENNKPKDEAAKKVKRPTAEKRSIQSVKRKMQNRSFKASIATSIHSLKESVSKKEEDAIQPKLNKVFSLIDKGVKKGIVKLNKAKRVKSQMSTLITAKS